MRLRRFGALLSLVAMLGACGGGGGSSPGGTAVTPTPTPTPTPGPSAGCSLRARQDWVAQQMREWYLFPETLPASLDPSGYASVDSYIDALTATARSQGRDRYFTYLTSIAEEDAFYASGSSAGFGFRLTLDSSGRLFVTEAFEGAPALAAGIDRGSEIVAIGTNGSNLRTVASILASEGTQGLSNALGPDTIGTTRMFRISAGGSTREVSVAKTEYEIAPVSSRYGARIIDDGGRRVGYLNLRTFISTADPALKSAFAMFRAQGVTELIVDFRYNGGGLVSIAELMGDLMGRDRFTTEIFSKVAFRPEKSSENSTRYFAPKQESVAPTRIAFIGTEGTASASELVINSFIPYLHANAALIGTNTYGKPVGQIALDQASCDDRLRVVAFSLQNAAGQGNYFNGLAQTVESSCQAADDIAFPLGDPREASTRAALDFIAGRSCAPIGAGISARGARVAAVVERRELLMPERPSTAQRESPGIF